jgi:hypothetical protein
MLSGGRLGPLESVEDASSRLTPIPVQTTTPSWQETAEEGAAAAQGTKDGHAPAAHPA